MECCTAVVSEVWLVNIGRMCCVGKWKKVHTLTLIALDKGTGLSGIFPGQRDLNPEWTSSVRWDKYLSEVDERNLPCRRKSWDNGETWGGGGLALFL